MQGRVRCKIASQAAKLRKLRRREAKAEVAEVITSFLQAANDLDHEDGIIKSLGGQGAEGKEPTRFDGNDSDEEFWMNLPAISDRTSRIQCIPALASRPYPGMMVRSRVSALRSAQLQAGAMQVEDVA